MHPINTAILAFGLSGRVFHAPFLETHEGFNLTTIVERTTKKAQHFYPNIRSVLTVEEVFSDPNIELIVVNTPNYTHFEYALKAIRSGKHVLIEKPFAITVKEAQQLFREGVENNVCVLPYHNRRYDSDFSSVKQVIESGKLGKIHHVHFRFDRFLNNIGPKKGKETLLPGNGFAYDLGSHLLDGLISLFGKPLEWSKTTAKIRPNTQVDDYIHFRLIYPEGMHVFATVDMLVADPSPAFTLYGANGSYYKYRADVQENQLDGGMMPDDPLYGLEDKEKEGILTTIDEQGKKVQEKITSPKTSYKLLFDCVYDSIRRGRPYPVTPEQIYAQLNMLENLHML